ncbi:MAG: SprT-like domain-containing protein [Bacteroidia bacterium]|nr:SprT-like domain-containing protein [Bacteroidia bacterium]NNF30635.1 sprT domain-containing protein [Flavobacteriaceae bacterium]MBT8276302.1 SprT-like domain-containing protein [Bacteroidia bacterium]NNJ81739.1 sprT domain-containing protein [Flavobacteriaceae bacterium]NNK53195.1 sprT domain-containing protein [Flavobacteriaceae bacterium]
MTDLLEKYIPRGAVKPVFELIKRYNVHLKIVNERVTRHGDYKKLPNGGHQITVNANLNVYRFLITLIHEIAHLVAFNEYGRSIKPHGKEWKHIFRQFMLPFIRPEIFPSGLLPLLAIHFKNPKASSDTDSNLSLALKEYDPPNDKNYIFEIPYGATFRLYNGKLFKRGNKRVKRYECLDLASGRIYLFNPNAEVEFIK